MIEIGDLQVVESWTEYAVEIEEDFTVECDDKEEAEAIAKNFGAAVLQRKGYLTEWHDPG